MSYDEPNRPARDFNGLPQFPLVSSIKTTLARPHAGGMLHDHTGVCVCQGRRSVDAIADNRKRSCLPV